MVAVILKILGKVLGVGLFIQAGDVTATWANVDDLIENFNYRPNTTIEAGLKKFTDWYKTYYAPVNLHEDKVKFA